MNKNKEFTTVEGAEKQIIRTNGFNPDETGIACYWGPNQKVNEEGERYQVPTGWKEEFLRVPKVVRFIYDEFEFKVTPQEPAPWEQVAGPFRSAFRPQPLVVYRRLSIHGDLYEYRPGFIPTDLLGEFDENPDPTRSATMGVRVGDPQPPIGNNEAYLAWALIYPVYNVFPNIWFVE